jgi:hypothetical protein
MILFHHLVEAERQLAEGKEVVFSCSLCRFSSRGKALLLQHARTLSHLR